MKKYSLKDLFSPMEYDVPLLSDSAKENIFSRTTRKKSSIMKRVKYLVPVGATLIVGLFVFQKLDLLEPGQPVQIVLEGEVDSVQTTSDLVLSSEDSFLQDEDLDLNNVGNQKMESGEIVEDQEIVENNNLAEDSEKDDEVVVSSQTVENDNVDQEETVLNSTFELSDPTDVDLDSGRLERISEDVVEEDVVEEDFVVEETEVAETKLDMDAVYKPMPTVEKMESVPLGDFAEEVYELPDLAVVYAKLTQTSSKNYYFEVQVANYGGGFEGIEILLSCSDKNGNIVISSKNGFFKFYNLAEGGKYFASMNFDDSVVWFDDVSLDGTVYCSVDSSSNLQESDEENNKQTMKFVPFKSSSLEELR